jgi:hypothetical protein
MPPLKLASKNIIETGLVEVRKRLNTLPDIARTKSLKDVSAQLLWLELDIRRIRNDIWNSENQMTLEEELDGGSVF